MTGATPHGTFGQVRFRFRGRGGRIRAMSSVRQILSIVLAALSVSLLAGCRSWLPQPPALQAWVASEMLTLTDQTPRQLAPLLCDAGPQTVSLFAAANETVGFQIVVDAGEEIVRDLHFEATDLSAGDKVAVPAAEIRAFRCRPEPVHHYPPWYLRLVDRIPAPANYYDALVPIDLPLLGQPYHLRPGERLVYWVDLHVPRDAPAGRYKGQILLRSATHADWPIRVAMQVYDFALPDSRPIAAVGGFDHDELYRALVRRDGGAFLPVRMDRKHPLVREGLVLMRRLMQLAHRHRLDLFDKQIRPVLKRDQAGKVRLDWEDYDAIVRPYLDGSAFADRVGCAAWPMPYHRDWPKPSYYGGLGDKRYARTLQAVVAGSHEHFTKALGFHGRMFAWPYRNAVTQRGYQEHAQLATLIRRVDPHTPILASLPLTPPALTGWAVPPDLDKMIDILAPPGHYLDTKLPPRMRRVGRPLAGGWLAPGTPPYVPSMGLVATAADVRAAAWFAVKYQCTGLFLPEVLHWAAGGGADDDAIARTQLFHYHSAAPGQQSHILPSIRLKLLRRGLQDVAYLWLLRQRRRSDAARAVVNAMVRYAALDAVGDNYLDPRLDGWVQDAQSWRMARRLLAEEIRGSIETGPAAQRALVQQRTAWRLFEDRTRDVVVEQVRCPVQPAPDGQKLRATVLLDLYNQYNRPIDVTVQFDKLPGTWQAHTPGPQVIDMAPTARRVVRLTAEGTDVPQIAFAKFVLPITLRTPLHAAKRIEAVVPLLVADRAGRPPEIDGVLNDWGLRTGNAAGGFRLIGRRGRGAEGLARRQTVVFVLHDDQNLYLAFRCEEPNVAGLVANRTNMVRYQQLMACGEDLVEVLLDPGVKARGPADLFHLVVKPNGILLAERGVRTHPPLGGWAPWKVMPKLAVGRQADAWIVEMAIPLTAFAAAGKESFWGVNFTRYAVQGCEASSWSGAPRYFYDPKNLGTMYLDRDKRP